VNIASIDIGTNAIRMAIYHVLGQNVEPKLLELIRVPIRLGTDVFDHGEITPETEVKLLKMAVAFRNLMEIFEVDAYRACATSAFREANNGLEVKQKLIENGIDLEVIDGDEEARLIFKAHDQLLRSTKNLLFIDVGGGSTELTLFENGKVKTSRSFKIGAVRILEEKVDPAEWVELEDYIIDEIADHDIDLAVGSGGNIRKLVGYLGRKETDTVSLARLEKAIKEIEKLSYQERLELLRFNPDRADVIVPGLKIYQKVMQWAKVERIMASYLGLKDGMIMDLIEKKI
jgi:exopolyphosphatase/guanosine-5'-triphosphate,3'-diphosphate pyrophosphatase